MHPSEKRQRRQGTWAMLAVGLVGLALALQQLCSESRTDMHGQHTDGPFRATVAVDGAFEFGPAVQAFHRGEAFGWASSFCAPPGAGLLLQARLVQAANNDVLLYRERMVAADALGCSSSRWDIVLPPDIPPGQYQLQRFLVMTPNFGSPRIEPLPNLAVEILP